MMHQILLMWEQKLSTRIPKNGQQIFDQTQFVVNFWNVAHKQLIQIATQCLPCADDGRHFSQKWVYKILPKGERLKRQWFLYSQSKEALLCFPCLLFTKDDKRDKSSFSNIDEGFNDWRHLNPFIVNHERLIHHRYSYVDWKELEIGLKTG